jgi:BMFP domain-containing protein YqiC
VAYTLIGDKGWLEYDATVRLIWMIRNEYEMIRLMDETIADNLREQNATLRARVAELEKAQVVMARELTSTDNADRYYGGLIDGYDHASRAIGWEFVSFLVNDNGEELQIDEIAITIGRDFTALATFAWPEEGQYAVMRRKEQPHVDDWTATPTPLASPPMGMDLFATVEALQKRIVELEAELEAVSDLHPKLFIADNINSRVGGLYLDEDGLWHTWEAQS